MTVGGDLSGLMSGAYELGSETSGTGKTSKK